MSCPDCGRRRVVIPFLRCARCNRRFRYVEPAAARERILTLGELRARHTLRLALMLGRGV